MNNLFFKSHETYEKLINKLDMLLAEQRHQRSDLALIIRKQSIIYNALALQKQVDEYFDEDEKETSPQTDSDNT